MHCLSPDEHLAEGSMAWVPIAVSCLGTMLLLGAIVATVIYYRRWKITLVLLDDKNAHVREMDNSHSYDNPVYETIA